MKIAIVIKRLRLLFVPKRERLVFREGYSVLIDLGWPTSILTDKMCDKAEAGAMRRYVGIQSWIAYKEEWEWAESSLEGRKIPYNKSTELERADVVELSAADDRLTS